MCDRMLYLGFVSVQELLSFQEDINSNKLWAEVRQELGGVLRAALDCKLADNPAQGKKIKATNQGRMRPSASAPASFHNPQPYQLSLPAATAWQERFVKNRPITNQKPTTTITKTTTTRRRPGAMACN